MFSHCFKYMEISSCQKIKGKCFRNWKNMIAISSRAHKTSYQTLKLHYNVNITSFCRIRPNLERTFFPTKTGKNSLKLMHPLPSWSISPIISWMNIKLNQMDSQYLVHLFGIWYSLYLVTDPVV